MKTWTAKTPAPNHALDPASERDLRGQLALLGHDGFGVTELRVFDRQPQVAYADNKNDTAYGDQNCPTD